MKLVCKVKIKNAMGLHARPATKIAQLLQGTKSTVWFKHKKETINARSIMSILMLAAGKNTQITITAEGEDAELVIKRLTEAFETQFGEEPR